MSLTQKETSYSLTSLENSIKGLDKSNGGMDYNEMKEFLRIFFKNEYLLLDNIYDEKNDSIDKLEDKSEEKVAAQAELDKIEKDRDEEYGKMTDIESKLITRDKLEKYMEEYLDSPRGKSFSKLPANNIYILTDRTKEHDFAIIQFSKRLINYMKKLVKLPHETSGRLDFGLKGEFQRGTFRFFTEIQEEEKKVDSALSAPLEISDDYELFFHIHPSVRFENETAKYEPPSTGDIIETITLQFKSYIQKPSMMFQQHLVIAPEGIYTLMLTKDKLDSMLNEVQSKYEQYKKYIANFITRMDGIFQKNKGISFKEATEAYNKGKKNNTYESDHQFYKMLVDNGANILENGDIWNWEMCGNNYKNPGHPIHMYDFKFLNYAYDPIQEQFVDNFVHPMIVTDLQIAQRAFNKVIHNIKAKILPSIYPDIDEDLLDLAHDIIIETKLTVDEFREDFDRLFKMKTKGMTKDNTNKYREKFTQIFSVLNDDDDYNKYITGISNAGLFISLQKWNYNDLKEYPIIRFKIVPIEDYDFDVHDKTFNPKDINVKKYIKL